MNNIEILKDLLKTQNIICLMRAENTRLTQGKMELSLEILEAFKQDC